MNTFARTVAFAIAAVAFPMTALAAPTAQPPSLPRTTAMAYTIHPGDTVSIDVYNEPSLSMKEAQVLEDGTIQYPLVGRVRLAGLTPSAAADALRSSLTRYVRHPVVNVVLDKEGTTNVLVMGNVKQPGKYALRNDARLSDAIAAAGGLGPTDGSFPAARVTELTGQTADASLQKLLHDGDSTQNLPLANNAIVYVQGPQSFRVQVVGAVDRPGQIDVNEGDRLSVAIARAGTSPNIYSDLNHVVVTRTDASGKSQAHEINMYEALKGGNMQYDPVLQKGDVVYVPQGRKPNQNNGAIGLLGRLIGLPF